MRHALPLPFPLITLLPCPLMTGSVMLWLRQHANAWRCPWPLQVYLLAATRQDTDTPLSACPLDSDDRLSLKPYSGFTAQTIAARLSFSASLDSAAAHWVLCRASGGGGTGPLRGRGPVGGGLLTAAWASLLTHPAATALYWAT